MTSPIGQWLRISGKLVGIVIVLTLGWAGYLRVTGNFHVVDAGQLYRSGQLTGSQLQARIKDNGIRSVLNLRGNNAGRAWYDNEVTAAAALGVQHIDFPMSAGRELTGSEISNVAALLRDLPRPLLIHCEAGADRTGLVSAIYELLIDRNPANIASGQLSFRYGHFPWLGSRTMAMDRTYERVVSALPGRDWGRHNLMTYAP